jgi:transposase
MTLHPEPIGAVPEETARAARAAFPKGNRYMRMRDELGTCYVDEQFADLFPCCGRVAEAPWRLALVLVMQFAENLTDRQAADAVRARIEWKDALGLELTDPGFHFSVLSEFRDRLMAGQAEERLRDVMLALFRRRPGLKPRGRPRTDATSVIAAIRELNRIEWVGETLRHALNVLAEKVPDWLKDGMLPDWVDRYVKPMSDYRLPVVEEERFALAERIGADGMYLLAQVYAPTTPPEWRQWPAIETVRQVWLQLFYQEQGQVRWRGGQSTPRRTMPDFAL